MGTTRISDHPAVPGRTCLFPTCEAAAVTETAMCEGHRRVAISQTGSWLEAG